MSLSAVVVVVVVVVNCREDKIERRIAESFVVPFRPLLCVTQNKEGTEMNL